MKSRSPGRSKRHESYEFYTKVFKLTVGGGVAFWLATIAISLLPIAASYRSAYSNWSIETVWIGSLFAGMIIGCCVSYSLLRFFGKIPAKNPIPKSVIISSVALVIATVLIDVPMVLHAPSDASYYFLVGAAFNTA